ncbi:ATP-binding protein [Actinokineospora iranica]|uniref:Anti-sigma regulatory factor (Ser/Thr protein kinase) n=1 Tax=Actinokineospora iranica TaxID=1271860 RepID=A0A1G6K0J0_9PSEU|nr:ATP-binding protein [Actinokineospora iranica]SDC24552.1 Anti-sigma regulatory factor (Ser/Thr protein kinase) [Actinokineospora iranica]
MSGATPSTPDEVAAGGEQVGGAGEPTGPPGPGTLAVTVPARPEHLAGLRRTLGGWLAGRGVPAPLLADIVLAADEALANAIEHGYRFADGLVALSGHVEDGHVVVAVVDHGVWKTPDMPPSPYRGRGMSLIRALADRVELVSTGGRTSLIARFRLPSASD